MTIGVYHVATDTAASDEGYACARLMVKSAKKHMPTVPVVHLTDETSPKIKGVDGVRRKPTEPMGLLRMRHCAGVTGDWLFVDTDIVFRRDVSDVFKKYFQIALTARDWPHIKAASGFTERMPFNTGVVFSRCPRFWAEVYTRLRDVDDPELQRFMGEQLIICDVALEGRYTIKTLSGCTYNFPPVVPGLSRTPETLQAGAAILHFKGKDRKKLMLGEKACA